MRADSKVLEAENTAAGRAGEGEEVVLEASGVRAQLGAKLSHQEAVVPALAAVWFVIEKGFQMQRVGCFGCLFIGLLHHVLCVSFPPLCARENYSRLR